MTKINKLICTYQFINFKQVNYILKTTANVNIIIFKLFQQYLTGDFPISYVNY